MPIDPTISLRYQMPKINDPIETMGGLMQLRAHQQQLQENDLSLQAKQRALSDDDAVRAAMQQTNGDPEAAIRQLETGGHAPAAAALRTKVYEWRDKQASTLKTNLENIQTNMKLAGQIAQGVHDDASAVSGKKAIAALLGPDMAARLPDTYDKDKWTQAVEWGRTAQEHITAQHNAITEAQEAMKLEQAGKKDAPETFDKWTSAGSKLLSVAQDQSQWDLARNLLKQGGAPDAVLAQFPAQFSPEAVKTVTALGLSQKDKADIANQALTRAETARHNRTQESLEQKKLDQAESDTPVLSDEAKRIAAQQWALTGTLPSFGYGKAAAKLRSEVMNLGGDMYKGLNLAEQKAANESNRKSLDALQPTLDKLEGFSKAANKNFDQFLELAKKLPDSGVPWLNTPIRLLDEKLVGAEYMPAINMARSVANREFARVTSDPGLKGALTDSARKEVDEIVPKDITLNQLRHLVPVIRTDMDNVRTSTQEQVDAIKARISAPPAGATSSPSGGAAAHKVGDVVIGPDGKKHKVAEVSPDGTKIRLGEVIQ